VDRRELRICSDENRLKQAINVFSRAVVLLCNESFIKKMEFKFKPNSKKELPGFCQLFSPKVEGVSNWIE